MTLLGRQRGLKSQVNSSLLVDLAMTMRNAVEKTTDMGCSSERIVPRAHSKAKHSLWLFPRRVVCILSEERVASLLFF